jgi:hypothetical protein
MNVQRLLFASLLFCCLATAIRHAADEMEFDDPSVEEFKLQKFKAMVCLNEREYNCQLSLNNA